MCGQMPCEEENVQFPQVFDLTNFKVFKFETLFNTFQTANIGESLFYYEKVSRRLAHRQKGFPILASDFNPQLFVFPTALCQFVYKRRLLFSLLNVKRMF